MDKVVRIPSFRLRRDSDRRSVAEVPREMEHSEQQGNSMTIGKPFQKGQSGNPGGRPKVVAEVKQLAREHTAEAIQTLASIMSNPKIAPAARVSAANSLLDRGYGKAPQHITGEGGPVYVARLPTPAPTAEAWANSLPDAYKPLLTAEIDSAQERTPVSDGPGEP